MIDLTVPIRSFSIGALYLALLASGCARRPASPLPAERAGASVTRYPPAGLDFSGIDAFWPVYEALLSDKEPTAGDLATLFATPGYAALEEREHRRRSIESAMRFAFMRSRSGQRDSVAQRGGFTGRSVQHLSGIPLARDSIEAFRRALTGAGVVAGARRAVAAFLPPGLADSVAPPPVAFVFFLDDGRGYPSLVVVDLLRVTRTGVDTGFFAHEFFHFYRRHFARTVRTAAPQDAGIEELLAYPAEEGVADQLDKRRYVEATDEQFAAIQRAPGASGYAREYRTAYEHAADMMRFVSTTLEQALASPDSATAIARAARDSLPDSGRALGAFMARTIDRVLGRPALIAAASDTYGFWLAYDVAAAHADGGTPRLSTTAVSVIRRLDSEYR
ncbi:MAG TPA: DUF5700 domain-containing putative Zn-dependent protease [Gemmatimonadaceae bacterium]|nr:DUF5700 domain-containing putative Zn-dependent protease [Gemmatimonadaceae bacterium]